jgi:DNA-binding transcriptional regulator LsrR (DeoR family)
MLDDRQFLYHIAALYYRDSLTQQEIAAKMHISRPMVSRALAKAQAGGIVRIELVPPAGLSDLEVKLAASLGLHRVIVAPQTNHNYQDRENRIRDIAGAAARFITELIQEGPLVVGVGWGVTVYRTILAMQGVPEGGRESVFVPLVGSAGRSESHYQVNVLVDRISEKMRGRTVFFNIPAFIRDQQLAEYLHSDPQLQAVQQYWKQLNLAIVGLGAFGEGIPSFPVGKYRPEEQEALQAKGVIGDILGRFFNANGFISDPGIKENDLAAVTGVSPEVSPEEIYLGIPVKYLKRVKQIICLCGGTQKVQGILQAARLGLITSLVTDTQTAKTLAEILEVTV